MRSTLSILLFLFGGIPAYAEWTGHQLLPSQQEPAQQAVTSLLMNLQGALSIKDSRAISALFTDDFVFRGCKEIYDKEKLIGLLMSHPGDRPVGISHISAKYVSLHQIEFNIIIAGLTSKVIDVQLLLDVGNGALASGSITTCSSKRHFLAHNHHGYWNYNEYVIQYATQYVNEVTASRGANFYSYNFFCNGCAGVINAARLSSIMMYEINRVRLWCVFKATAIVVSSNGREVEFDLSFHYSNMVFRFTIELSTGLLVRATIFNCPSAVPQPAPPPPAPIQDAREFQISFLNEFIDSLDFFLPQKSAKYFTDNFFCGGCKGSITTAQFTTIVAKGRLRYDYGAYWSILLSQNNKEVEIKMESSRYGNIVMTVSRETRTIVKATVSCPAPIENPLPGTPFGEAYVFIKEFLVEIDYHNPGGVDRYYSDLLVAEKCSVQISKVELTIFIAKAQFTSSVETVYPIDSRHVHVFFYKDIIIRFTVSLETKKIEKAEIMQPCEETTTTKMTTRTSTPTTQKTMAPEIITREVILERVTTPSKAPTTTRPPPEISDK